MTNVSILGLDPGPTPGMVMLEVNTAQRVKSVRVLTHTAVDVAIQQADWVAVERFIIGNATTRRTRAGSMATIAMTTDAYRLAMELGKQVQYLPAGTVKPWATDLKLRAWGLYEPTVGGGGHARDAARHALYMAVRGKLLPPLPPKRLT